MAKIEIYTLMLCGYCDAAKRLLIKKGIAFTEFDVTAKPGLRREMTERSGGAASVPQIFINGVAMGGCDDLMELERDNRLDSMLKGDKSR